jgi:hypothetical protein
MKEKKVAREQAKEDYQIQQQLQRELKGQKKKAKKNRKLLKLIKPVIITASTAQEVAGPPTVSLRLIRQKRTPQHLQDYEL